MGNTVNIKAVDAQHPKYKYAMSVRENLLDAVSLYDDEIAELLLSNKPIPVPKLHSAIKQIINNYSLRVCALLVGSAYKNRGI